MYHRFIDLFFKNTLSVFLSEVSIFNSVYNSNLKQDVYASKF